MTLTFNEIPVPKDLTSRIHDAIAKAHVARRRMMVFVGSTFGALSLASMVLLVRTIYTSLEASGFFSYISILFSDGSAYWKEIGLSILDSLPVWGIAAFLAVTTAFIVSTAQVIRNTRKTFITSKIIAWN